MHTSAPIPTPAVRHAFLISAAHKSSGKTTLSIGLSAALTARRRIVQTYKKGPDYIDPMWLSQATGRACRNLDPYLSDSDEIRSAFTVHARGSDVQLIEGNKGLHDGISLDGSNSNAALAAILDVPVVLVIDTRGMMRGIAPLLLGTQAFDRRIKIAGVILNRVGGSRHEAKLRAAIEHYTDISVLGAVAQNPALAILERHLGLIPSNEADNALRQIELLGSQISQSVDLDALLAVSATDPTRASPINTASPDTALDIARPERRVRIGIANDRAFGFYYADDIDALAAEGAELVPIDTLHDTSLPAIDGLFIGGGFPESMAPALSANAVLRKALHRRIEAGLPVYAECGGLMYLSRSITWKGKRYDMVGAIPGDALMHDKPIGRGYVTLQANTNDPWPGSAPAEILGHEFHYSSLTNLAPDVRFAFKVTRGCGIDTHHDGIVYRNVLACYAHLRSTNRYNWAKRFVEHVRRCRALPNSRAEAA